MSPNTNRTGIDTSARPGARSRKPPARGIARGHPVSDHRSLEMMKRIAQHIDAEPVRWMAHARANLARWIREANEQEATYTQREWRALLERHDWHRLRAMLLAETDEGQRLRSSHPFTGILSVHERRAVYEAIRP